MNHVHILETYDAQLECEFVCLIKSINGIKKVKATSMTFPSQLCN